MVFGLFARVARVRVTVGYAAIVTCVTVALVILGPRIHDRVVRHASTNLHNLSHGHFGTLLDSAFVMDDGPIYVWLPGLLCVLALAELMWRSRRLVVAFALGHIGATLVVALGLTAAIELDWLPTSVSRATDVGMSYGVMAVLGALTAAIPGRWRPAWIGWWLAVGLTVAVIGHDFTDVGHTVALVLGMLVSTRFGHPARWTTSRYVLLVISAAFGYLILANTEPSTVVAAGVGALSALVADRLTRRRLTRRAPALPTPVTAEPALQV
jgi:hypothetical protein